MSSVVPATNLVLASPSAARLPFVKFTESPGFIVAPPPTNRISIVLGLTNLHLLSPANNAIVP